MRKVFVSVAVGSLILGLGACTGGTGKQAGAADGVTGATIKRAAVGGNYVDFGGDANSVENYDLQTQSASVDNPVASDAQRDQEIDQIVNRISDDDAPSSAQPVPRANFQIRPAPAVPQSSRGGSGSSIGVTGSVVPADDLLPLPSLPDSAGNPAAGEDAAMAAERDRLFPKPRWRRELESKPRASQSAPAPLPTPSRN